MVNELVLKIKQEYPESEIIYFVDTLVVYNRGDYLDTIERINSVIENIEDKENKYILYVIKGDCLRKLKDNKNAITSYEAAVEIREEISLLRKLGNTYLACANEYSYSNITMLKKAKNCFKTIYDNYYSTVDDVINLAQTYRLLGDNKKCISTLSSYISENQIEDFRVYMQMAIAGHESSDPNTSFYCQKAYDLYQKSSGENKKLINNKDFSIIKNLYEQYCNAVW